MDSTISALQAHLNVFSRCSSAFLHRRFWIQCANAMTIVSKTTPDKTAAIMMIEFLDIPPGRKSLGKADALDAWFSNCAAVVVRFSGVSAIIILIGVMSTNFCQRPF